MPAINEDLWPDLNLAPVVTPLSILREQAALLGKRTKGVLRGEVETWGAGERISNSFNIVVPSLGDYKYTLLYVQERLVYSAGVNPAGARVRSPVAWIVGRKETES
jgi:hypothetical protein